MRRDLLIIEFNIACSYTQTHISVTIPTNRSYWQEKNKKRKQGKHDRRVEVTGVRLELPVLAAKRLRQYAADRTQAFLTLQ